MIDRSIDPSCCPGGKRNASRQFHSPALASLRISLSFSLSPHYICSPCQSKRPRLGGKARGRGRHHHRHHPDRSARSWSIIIIIIIVFLVRLPRNRHSRSPSSNAITIVIASLGYSNSNDGDGDCDGGHDVPTMSTTEPTKTTTTTTTRTTESTVDDGLSLCPRDRGWSAQTRTTGCEELLPTAACAKGMQPYSGPCASLTSGRDGGRPPPRRVESAALQAHVSSSFESRQPANEQHATYAGRETRVGARKQPTTKTQREQTAQGAAPLPAPPTGGVIHSTNLSAAVSETDRLRKSHRSAGTGRTPRAGRLEPFASGSPSRSRATRDQPREPTALPQID